MVKLTFDDIRNRGLLLYEYIRGSKCHGIDTPTSDTDMGGVFMAPAEQLIGLGLDYQEQVADEKNDTVWFELNKFMNLLLKSNPTVMESLFVDPEFIIYEHPIISEIKKHRDEFVTKACFPSFFGYAQTQIDKARGLNKKIVNPITKRLTPLDFCYTYYKQGSSSMSNWLERRGLDQKYCGIVNINHMRDNYSVFYDWGAQFTEEGITLDGLIQAYNTCVADMRWHELDKLTENGIIYPQEYVDDNHTIAMHNMAHLIVDTYKLNRQDSPFVSATTSVETNLEKWFEKYKTPFNYRGIQKDTGNDVHCSSIAEFEPPICYMSYNRDGYSTHCVKYREYVEWEKKRNVIRYESNLHKNYDAKNMCECFRLIHMGMEIARGEGVKVNRRNIDREFLLDIKAHKFEYDYLINLVTEKKKEMDEAMATSSLKDRIDVDKVNDILVSIRKNQLGIK